MSDVINNVTDMCFFMLPVRESGGGRAKFYKETVGRQRHLPYII